MSKQTIREELYKDFLMLERYEPDSLIHIKEKLTIAETNIIEKMESTQNKAQIRSIIGSELTKAFKDFDTEVIKDIEQITNATWINTFLTMQTALKDTIVPNEIKEMPKAVKQKINNPNRLILGKNITDHKNNLIFNGFKKIRTSIIKGVDNNTPIDEIHRTLKNQISIISSSQVKTVVRTALLSAINEAKQEQFNQLFKDDNSLVYVYSSALDTRTSPYCMNANGYTTKNIKASKYKTNSHYNCRSLWVPSTKDIEEYDDKYLRNQQIVQWDSRKVNHRDGTTSTKFTFSSGKSIDRKLSGKDVFDKFDRKYKIKYLGETRYKLYKSGKLNYNDMIDLQKNTLVPLKNITRL